MKLFALIMLSIFVAGLAEGAVRYKCDGEWVDYWPCDNKPTDDSVTTGAPHKSGEVEPLVFVGDQSVRLVLVAAEVEAAQIAARDCDWELKVDKGSLKCLDMMLRVGKNSRHQQATDELMRLVKDEAFYEQNRSEFNRLYGIQLEIYKVITLFKSVYSS